MATTMYGTVNTLTVTRCWCGIEHAVPESLYRVQVRERDDEGRVKTPIYCPLGHQWFVSGESKSAKLERELARERAQNDQQQARLRDRLEHTERSRAALKGQVTKIKKRVGHGVCPCCSRTFQNLATHMQQEHPEFAQEPTDA